MKGAIKIAIAALIILAAVFFISWSWYIDTPGQTNAKEHSTFRGKPDVLQVSPDNDSYGWAILEFNLNQYAGQRINLGVSMQVWLDAPEKVCWQVNNQSLNWPIIAGNFTPLKAGQWNTVQGSYQFTVQAGNILYLSNYQSDNRTMYIADLNITVNGQVINNKTAIVDNNIPALHTKWPFPVGVAIPSGAFLQSNLQSGLLRHFNVLVADNQMKPSEIMPNPWTPTGAYRWFNTDAFLNYAESNKKSLRGHVLFWHEQIPEAFFKISGRDELVTIDELYTRMEHHVETVFKKCGGRIAWWDVCNEVVREDGNPRSKAASPNSNSFYGQIMEAAGKRGMDRYEYVLKAFQFARKYADANGGQNVKLFLTDYDIEYRGAKQNGFFKLLDYLIANNAPIDGVGIQGHIKYDLSSSNIKDFGNAIDAFSSKQKDGKNLVVHVCELDISLYKSNETNWNNLPSSKKILSERDLNARIKQQAALYRKLFDMFEQKYNQGKLEMVLIWGLDEGHSWLNYFFVQGREDYPLLFNRNYQPNAAFYELIKGRL